MAKFYLILVFQFAINFGQGQNIETVVQRSGGGKTTDMAISADGLFIARIADALLSSEIEIWNVKAGSLLRVIRTTEKADLNYALKKIRFWQNGKYIITGTSSGTHEIFEVASGNLVKQIPVVSWAGGAFAVSEKTGVFAFLDPLNFERNEIILYDLYSGTIFDTLRIAVYNISCLEFSPDGKEIAVGTTKGSFHMVEMKSENGKRNIRQALDVFHGPVSFLQWTNDNYLLAEDDSMFVFMNLDIGKLIQRDSLEPGCRIVTSPTEDCYYIAGQKYLSRFNPQFIEQKRMGINPDIISSFSIDKKNERLYILTNHFIRVWDLKNISQSLSVNRNQISITGQSFTANKNNDQIKLLPDLHSMVFNDAGKFRQIPIDTTGKEIVYTPTLTGTSNFIISVTNEPIAGVSGKISGWDNGKRFDIATGSSENILFRFHQSKTIAAASTRDSLAHIYAFPAGAHQIIKVKGEIYCGAASPEDSRFAIAGSSLYLFDTRTLTKKELYDSAKENFVIQYQGQVQSSIKWPGQYQQLVFSQDGNILYTLDRWGQVKVWDLLKLKLDSILNMHAGYIEISPDGKRLLASVNNELIWLNASNLTREASIAFLAEGDYIVSLPDNHYKSSRNGARAVGFTQGMKASGFDQYDLVFNRPDIVTRKLGRPTAEMQESLDKTVIKRLIKMGVADTSQRILQLEAPEVAVRNYSSLPTTVTNPLIKFTIELRDKSNFLSAFYTYLNGVPTNGKNGLDILGKMNGQKIKEMSIDFTLRLDPGKNLIEISCMNDKGISSARESFEIFYNDTAGTKPNLYFIGIGAGRYQDSSRNLKYPSKDISDVASLFKNKTSNYHNVDITILSNEHVTIDDIQGLRKKLELTNTMDEVIIYWSGHGLLSKDLDYYLATFNTDFSHPEKGSMAYEDVENLFDNIPARKRLLFLDACHSGEIDKDEITLVRKDSISGKNKTDTDKGIIIAKRQKNITSELLNELFSDIRRGTGANVISAAGGSEFALEGDRWGNGVFTYVLLSGLSDKKADYNKDGQITISELQSYLQVQVPQLTSGRQTPTSRTENLISDWRIW